MKTKQEIYRIKSHIQSIALKTIEDNDYWGALEMATGTGKSKVPIDYIKKYDSQSIGLLVPTEKLRDENWKEEFTKWGADKYWDKVDRHCYASASKVKGKHYNLLICDEGHNLTKRSMKFFENNKVDCLILLTATMPSDKAKVAIFEELGIKTVFRLTLEEAEELGIIKPFIINVVYTQVNSKVKNVLLTSKQKKTFFVTEKERLDFLDKNVEVNNPYDSLTPSYLITASQRKNFQFAVLKRAQFIYNLQSKVEAADFLLRAYIPEGKRTLIFTSSIETAKKLCKHSFHSKEKKLSEENFKKFKANEIERLSCVNGLNEGHNIEGVDCALVEQLNSNEINLIQRIGRALRFEENKSGEVWILVAKDTQDEVWASSALKSFNPSKIKYHNLSDLQSQYVKKFKEENGIKH